MMGNNEPCKIVKIGNVKIKMFDRAIKTLDHVRHIPRINRNVVSQSILNSKEYMYTGGGGILKVGKVLELC